MPTKLSRYCLGVMEAAWLAAVSVVPIFFNVYSARIFEPDKITILRSLALLTLAAWAIKLVDEGGIKWKAENTGTSLIKYILKYPLLAPVIGLVVVYSISTIFSVTPSISFFGSYQRLEGTYTTFSYLVIFLSIIANLRTRQQINRLVTTVIIASLPISLYGLLQRFQIDPIPWGGNVSIRIAANMGNSIFVAAYLIMVFPLTVGRMVESFQAILSDNENEKNPTGNTLTQIVRATIYVFIAALELIAIYMSGSRGPLLGLMAGLYFMLLLYSIYWRKRWLTYTSIAVAILGAGFLAVFNMSTGPLEALKTSPAIGRFGNLLNSESNSALVRQYIWEGTVKLVGIHAPLKFPDGTTDKFNFLRPIIGYGPETMYVAFNQFYQPELGQVEKRNASPDRAHNETWDSIVITGVAGLLAYLAIFSSVFYYGLKWQGLIKTRRNKLFFLACLVSGGVIGSIALIVMKGVEYLGVGLPFGMIVGLIVYLTLYSLVSFSSSEQAAKSNPYLPLLIVMFSAIVGHFVEINFGIAIVATRTLFWTYAGLILVIGFVLPKMVQAEPQVVTLETNNEIKPIQVDRKKAKLSRVRARRIADRNKRPIFGDLTEWLRNSLIGAVFMGIILATLGYDYITNSPRSASFIGIVIDSLTRLPNKDNALSFGILLLILITWIVSVLLFTAESANLAENHTWLSKLGFLGLISIAIGVIFWLLQGISLSALASFTVGTTDDLLVQVSNIGALLTKFYLFIFMVFVLISFILPDEWPARGASSNTVSAILVPVLLISVFTLANASNLRVIDADITFKMADPFTKNGKWDIATLLYQRSLELTPQEDHYYLFLGRSYLEQAKLTQATADQDSLVLKAERDLKVAQSINPLNTDHTANLARLYSWWAGQATTQATRTDRAEKASEYYTDALTLSPNNSTLWDEWAVLDMQLLNNPQSALEKMNHALSLDQKYNFTQGLFGDYYLQVANSAGDPAVKEQALMTAAEYYRTAADVSKSTDTTPKASYLVSLGNVLTLSASLDPQNINRQQYQQAIGAFQEAIDAGLGSSDLWKVQQAIAKIYLQLGDKANALFYANQAIQSVPDTAKSQIQDLISQIQSTP
jgi:tetratricopeptide (TPR) repeat protein/O-antigen ligase